MDIHFYTDVLDIGTDYLLGKLSLNECLTAFECLIELQIEITLMKKYIKGE